MKYARSVALALCSTWMLLVFSAPVAAKPDFAAKEKETCPTCHVMAEFPKRFVGAVSRFFQKFSLFSG